VIGVDDPRWLATLPHLVRPLPFVAALNDELSPRGGVLTELGVRAGDVLRLGSGTRHRTLPGPRRITAVEARRLLPRLRRDDLHRPSSRVDGLDGAVAR